jgi:hypothetical protein
MPNSPNRVNDSYTRVDAIGPGNNVLNPSIHARLQIWFGRTSPGVLDDAISGALFHQPNTPLNFYWQLNGHTTDAALSPTNAGNIGCGLYIYEDNTDGNGGNNGNHVEFIQLRDDTSITFPAEDDGQYALLASGTGQVSAGSLLKAGTYRAQAVLYHLIDANPPTIAKVTEGPEFYFDADRYSDFENGGALDPDAHLNAFEGTVQTVGRIRILGEAQNLIFSGPRDKNYGDTFTISGDLHDNSMINPKQVRAGVSLTSASSVSSPIESRNVTPSTVGNFGPTTNFNVDTTYSALPENYVARVWVGPVGGQSTTLDAEKPDLLTGASPTYKFANSIDQSWVAFRENQNSLLSINSSGFSIEYTGRLNIGSSFSLWKNATFTDSGVAVYSGAGFLIYQDVFRRSAPTTSGNATPHFQCFVRNAHSGALANINLTANVVRPVNGVNENSNTTLTTDISGRIRWSYTIPNTAPAFNRFVKAGVTRVAGSHVSNGPDNASSPPATFSSGNSSNLADYQPPYPCYPRNIIITGRTFGSEEPGALAINVFGVNSELIGEDIWTGGSTAANLNPSGVPLGAGVREQQLGAGSLKAKVTTSLNEGNVKVINTGEHNIKDVAGRNVTVLTDNIFLRRALWDDTLDSVTDGGTNLNDAQTALSNALGYKEGANSLDTIAAPADPTSYIYYQGFSQVSQVRDSFSLTANGSSPSVGFTLDTGNFGYVSQICGFVALDSTIKCLLNAETAQSDPTVNRRFTIKTVRITPDGEFFPVAPDEPPIYGVFGQQATGAMQLLLQSTGIPIGAQPTPDWEFFLAIPTGGFKAVKVVAFAKVNGSRTIGGSESTIQIGYEFDALAFAAGFPFK